MQFDNKNGKERVAEFDIGRQNCISCGAWRYFYRRKDSDGLWFCQICSHEVETVEK